MSSRGAIDVKRMNTHGNEAGASLLEVMAVAMIISLGALLAGEGFLGAVSRNQAMVVGAELASELRMARSMAMTKRTAIRVSFESSGTAISTESVGRPNAPLRTYDFSGTGVTVEGLSGEGLSGRSSVVFYPSGRAATPTTITLLRQRAGERRKLTVSITGRVTIK
ncbi:MAG: GspH/FimT family protein [Nitrospirales bacterium]